MSYEDVPVIWVHSINETESLTTLDTLCQNKTMRFKFPVRVLTRNSQKEQYSKTLKNYSDYFSSLCLETAEDSEISNLGKTKNYEINKSYDYGHANIFMLDDDITTLEIKSSEVEKVSDPEDMMNKWYTEHVKMLREDERCVVTSVLKDLSTAKTDGTPELYMGICTQCTLLNTIRAKKFNIFYGDNNVVGHEDIDYRAELIKNGKTYYRFTDLIYGSDPLNTDTFAGDTLQERFTRQRDLFKKKWGEEYPWILYVTSKINGVELDDIKLDPFINKRGTFTEIHKD